MATVTDIDPALRTRVLTMISAAREEIATRAEFDEEWGAEDLDGMDSLDRRLGALAADLPASIADQGTRNLLTEAYHMVHSAVADTIPTPWDNPDDRAAIKADLDDLAARLNLG